MPVVPLGMKAYARPSAQQPETRLVNLLVEKDESGASPDAVMLLQRPGLTRLQSFADSVRAIYQSSNSIESRTLLIVGDTLQTDDGEVIGMVADDGLPARIEATSLAIGIVSAGTAYLYDGATFTVVQMRDDEDEGVGNTLTDLQPIVDVDVLNGYFLFASSTGTFYWLVPGEKSVNPLNYATAEALPDGCVGVRRLRDDIYLFGANSIEVWQATGDPDATFQRGVGRLVDRGCMARDTVAVFDNSFVWLGDDGIVYRMSDTPMRISDFGIEERIKNRTDDCSAWVCTTFGHKLYVLSVPGQGTLVYDASSQLWSEFASVGSLVWKPHVGRDTPSGTICGDPTGKTFRLDPDSSLDDGQPFLRLVTGTVAIPLKPIANSSVTLAVGSDGDAAFSMRWRDPRRDWSQPLMMTARGEGDTLPWWRLGLARPPFRQFEFSTLAATKIRISGAMANEAWRT